MLSLCVYDKSMDVFFKRYRRVLFGEYFIFKTQSTLMRPFYIGSKRISPTYNLLCVVLKRLILMNSFSTVTTIHFIMYN